MVLPPPCLSSSGLLKSTMDLHCRTRSWVSVTAFLVSLFWPSRARPRPINCEIATDREKFLITATYHRQVTGNLEQAQQTFELWSHTYPRDVVAHGLASGFVYQGSGKYEKSIEEAKKAIALNPDSTPAYINLAFSNVYVGRLQEAEKALQRASERNLYYPFFSLLGYYIAFLKGDETAMDREAARAGGNPGDEAPIVHSKALALARSGRVELARKCHAAPWIWLARLGSRNGRRFFKRGQPCGKPFSGMHWRHSGVPGRRWRFRP